MGGKNTKGDRRERELVNHLDDTDQWAVMRAPASGSATKRELPDVLFGDGENFYAAEAKSSGGDPIYIAKEEIEDLYFFAMKFGAKARVAVRFDDEYGDPPWGNDDDNGWRFFDPEDLHQTEKSYRIKKETAYAGGDRMGDL